MCCGQKRAALRNDRAPRVPAPNAPAPGSVGQAVRPVLAGGPSAAEVLLQCVQGAPIRVRGPVTGRFYSFSSVSQTKAVDARDAIVLLRMPQFRRVVG
jgi:hypothetical protein